MTEECPGPRGPFEGNVYECRNPRFWWVEPDEGETWDDFCEDCNAGRAEEIDRQVKMQLECGEAIA